MSYPAGWPMRAHQQRDPGIPLRSYFLFVGGALLALLFATSWLLPLPPSDARIGSVQNLPNIRIHSALKGPEAVVIDTITPLSAQAPPVQMDIAGRDAVGLAGPPAQQAETPRQSGPHTSLASAELRDSFAQLVAAPKQPVAGESKAYRPSSPGRRGQ